MASGILKSKVSTYEFSLEDLKMLIAADLDVFSEDIEVEYVIREVGGDPMDNFPGVKTVTGVRVTLKHDVTD